MKVAITGARGVVGSVLAEGLDRERFQVVPLDLPDHDVSDLQRLTTATKGCDAIIHLAWAALGDNYQSGTIDPVNNAMTFNVYQAAAKNGIGRVIMGSSNHAHRHDLRDTDGKIRASQQPPVPDSPYGAEKVFMESLGRYFSYAHDMAVICIRIGNVNKENTARPSSPDNPSRWQSHADFVGLVTCALTAAAVPGNFEIVYGVSNQPVFDWSNSFGYVPKD